METVELAPGFSVSRILTGLWQIADMERGGRDVDPASAADAMRPYVEAGLTAFDMADHYGSAEVIAGTFRSRHPDLSPKTQLLTKWVPKPGPVTRDEVREAVELALERLQSESIDLLQFHAWSYADPSYLDTLFHLEELRREGRIRHLGLTNFDAAHLRLVIESGIEVVSNQVCLSLLDRRAAGAMSELCRERGIGILAYGTLGGGLLTERWLGQAEPRMDDLATWSQRKYKRLPRRGRGLGGATEAPPSNGSGRRAVGSLDGQCRHSVGARAAGRGEHHRRCPVGRVRPHRGQSAPLRLRARRAEPGRAGRGRRGP